LGKQCDQTGWPVGSWVWFLVLVRDFGGGSLLVLWETPGPLRGNFAAPSQAEIYREKTFVGNMLKK